MGSRGDLDVLKRKNPSLGGILTLVVEQVTRRYID
jgi:hypothetical protein